MGIEEKSIKELLSNLALEISRLKKRLDHIEKKQVETDYKAGQALTSVADVGDIKDRIEMIIDDIVLLDERTQGLIKEGCKCKHSR